jgi:hypothetical protein
MTISPFTGANIRSAVIIGENNYIRKGLIKFVEKDSQLGTRKNLSLENVGMPVCQTIHPHTPELVGCFQPANSLSFHNTIFNTQK